MQTYSLRIDLTSPLPITNYVHGFNAKVIASVVEKENT